MCEEYTLSFVTSGGRVSTVGLLYVNHRELCMRAITPEATREAKEILMSLASHVITTRAQLRPGDAFAFQNQVVRIELGGPDHMEVVSCGPSWLVKAGLVDRYPRETVPG
jgi:hypothetical protein